MSFYQGLVRQFIVFSCETFQIGYSSRNTRVVGHGFLEVGAVYSAKYTCLQIDEKNPGTGRD